MSEAIVEGRRERRKRELRTRIYETARVLFLEHGFEATTVAQITEAADVAEGTFFNHFASKQALLAEMASEVSSHLQGLVDEQLARPVSAPERVVGFAERVAEQVGQTRGLARDVVLELMKSSARSGEAYPYLSDVHAPFAAIISEGQGRGEVRGDFDAGFLAEMVVGALHVAVTRWIADPAYPLGERLRETAAFITDAIRPRDSSAAASDRSSH